MDADESRIRALLEAIPDPEIPVLNIVEMGIVRDIVTDGDRLRVDITPTYTGCPAMHAIKDAVERALADLDFAEVEVRTVYAPAWTTDSWTEETRRKLKDYGIAPPGMTGGESPLPFSAEPKTVACPFCDATDTELKSAFGSTACKSLHFCRSCRQPFEHFKCH
jgi:ring-1,2-phenylacetyl-CoA epoxidase subunit PaaD